MIVITSLSKITRYVYGGDTFNLTISDGMNHQVIIKEEITLTKKIDFIASYRFALEDGTCPGFHLCGIFGNRKELPEEIKNAKMIDDLSKKQRKNFIKSVGIKIIRSGNQI